MDTERLSNELDGLVTWLSQTIQETEGFVREQAPLYINELLTWGAYEAAAISIGFVMVSFTAIVLATCFLRLGNRMNKEDTQCGSAGDAWQLASGIIYAVAPFTLWEAFGWFLQYIHIQVAPRVYLLEELRKLL